MESTNDKDNSECIKMIIKNPKTGEDMVLYYDFKQHQKNMIIDKYLESSLFNTHRLYATAEETKQMQELHNEWYLKENPNHAEIIKEFINGNKRD